MEEDVLVDCSVNAKLEVFHVRIDGVLWMLIERISHDFRHYKSYIIKHLLETPPFLIRACKSSLVPPPRELIHIGDEFVYFVEAHGISRVHIGLANQAVFFIQ